MKFDVNKINHEINSRRNVIFYIVGGILALTVAFGAGRLTTDCDPQHVCRSWINDAETLQMQLGSLRTKCAASKDEIIKECRDEERTACQAKIESYKASCRALTCAACRSREE